MSTIKLDCKVYELNESYLNLSLPRGSKDSKEALLSIGSRAKVCISGIKEFFDIPSLRSKDKIVIKLSDRKLPGYLPVSLNTQDRSKLKNRTFSFFVQPFIRSLFYSTAMNKVYVMVEVNRKNCKLLVEVTSDPYLYIW